MYLQVMLKSVFVYNNRAMVAIKLLCSLFILINQIETTGAASISQSDSSLVKKAGPLFTEEERRYVVEYWNQPNRYQISSPTNVTQEGTWQVRLTPEGSTWFWNYNKARNISAPPTQIPKPQNEEQKVWEEWIEKKIAYDRWHAFQSVQASNSSMFGMRAASRAFQLAPSTHPGPIPEGLLNLAGNPPTLVTIVAPKKYLVSFDPQTTFEYTDSTLIRNSRFAYFRFQHGVNSGGLNISKMPRDQLESLFEEAGIGASEQKVMKAISMLEGGFAHINTYDTGYISVGFLQFASLKNGDGSLSELLFQHKLDDPKSFFENFHLYGIDVNVDKLLTVVDPATGAELSGSEAVHKIVEDKRLTAVFQRAATLCRPFLVAQLKYGSKRFYPAQNTVTLDFGGKKETCKISNFIRSEAGMATLMDRKLNIGNLNRFKEVLASFIKRKKIRSIEDLAGCERELIKAMCYRKNFLEDKSLSQP